jgi:hypothetical protein
LAGGVLPRPRSGCCGRVHSRLGARAATCAAVVAREALCVSTRQATKWAQLRRSAGPCLRARCGTLRLRAACASPSPAFSPRCPKEQRRSSARSASGPPSALGKVKMRRRAACYRSGGPEPRWAAAQGVRAAQRTAACCCSSRPAAARRSSRGQAHRPRPAHPPRPLYKSSARRSSSLLAALSLRSHLPAIRLLVSSCFATLPLSRASTPTQLLLAATLAAPLTLRHHGPRLDEPGRDGTRPLRGPGELPVATLPHT